MHSSRAPSILATLDTSKQTAKGTWRRAIGLRQRFFERRSDARVRDDFASREPRVPHPRGVDDGGQDAAIVVVASSTTAIEPRGQLADDHLEPGDSRFE